MTTIGFVIHPKAEDDVYQFVKINSRLIGKIVVTKTDKAKVETLFDKKDITQIPSLLEKGDSAMAAKVSKGEVQAVFFINPLPENASGVMELVAMCAKRKIYLALTVDTADCILGRIGTSQPTMMRKESRMLKGGTIKLASGSVPVIGPMALLASRESAERAEKRSLWSNQQLTAWLDISKLTDFQTIFNDSMPSSTWTRHDHNDNMLQVKAGSEQHLVELLTTARDNPLSDIFDLDTYVRDFFMTYSAFCPPKRLLELLRERLTAIWEDSSEKNFDRDDAEDNTKAIIRIVQIWITIEDAACFARDHELHKAMLKFIDGPIKTYTDEKTALPMRKQLEATIQLYNTPIPEPDPKGTPMPAMKRRDGTVGIELVDIDVEELARQMTLMESNIVRRLCTYEFMKTAWTKRNAAEIAPNLTKAIECSNHFANWMITEILKQKTFEHMSELIVKLIKLGKAFQHLHNYSGVLQVVTALSNSAINKLKGAWALIPAKSKDMILLEELTETVSPLGHYKKYRDAFAARPANEPCLPILAATLSDLNGYEEVFNATTADGSVNWMKMSRVGARIWDIVSLNVSYDFKPVYYIQNFIKEGASWTDNLTTCAIADLRCKEINKAAAERNEKDKRSSSKRKSTNTLGDADAGPRDELTDRDWQLLMTNCGTTKIFSAGQVVLAAGSPNDSLFRINRGSVKVIKEIGEELMEVAKMGEDSMFGEVSMLLRSQKEGTATASIVAAEETEILVLAIDAVMSLLASKPGLAEKLNRILAIKLARRLRDLGKKGGALTPASSSDAKAVKDAIAQIGTPSKKDDEKSKKPLDPNAKFNKRFGLEGEQIFKTFQCSIRKPEEDKAAHGTMYVTQNYLCFDVTLFGLKDRHAFPFAQISEWKKKTKSNVTTIHITTAHTEGATQDWIIGHLENADDVHSFAGSIWKHQQSQGAPKKEFKRLGTKTDLVSADGEAEGSGAGSWLPAPADWTAILNGARIVNFKKDDVVMKEGEATTRVFQLVHGECRFEKVIDGQNKVLGKMALAEGSTDNLFGEISFLEGGKASASVVCDKDETQIAIIEGYWLDVLFQYYPELSGRFYHYLANVLSKRLKQRESAAQNSSSNPPLPSSSSSNSLHVSTDSQGEASSSKKSRRDKKDKKDKRDKSHSKRKSDTRPEETSDGEEAAADAAE
jgi:CRP-like cAMP-binding protein/methylglyoxal synthase